MLLVPISTPEVKKFQGSSPARRKIGYLGTCLAGIRTVKTMVKTSIMPSGFNRLQRKPMMLPL